MSVDLHRHDEFSTFDGFGKATSLVKLAKEYGYSALGIANHGNVNGLIQHYDACKSEDIKPILGIESYFQPVFNKEDKRYHLCLFAKNLNGYRNLNKLSFEGENQRYYKPIITFSNLRESYEGLICTSGCIAGYIPQMILKGENTKAVRAIQRFKDIFQDDFYIEIQPYKIDDLGTQEKVNLILMKLAKEYDVKVIMTSDSHYGAKEDWPTYFKMHEIGNSKYDVEKTYKERYMPKVGDLSKRFIHMYKDKIDINKLKKKVKELEDNLLELEESVEFDILSQLPLKLPEFIEGKDSYDILEDLVKKNLKEKGKFNKKYINRCKEELKIIKMHGYSDYFLMVADYVSWAKERGIKVGPGRGSVCNCQVAWALKITDVDSLYFGLDFRRFLREDKIKLPDIDLDFETNRRQEVIDYIIKKYKGHAAQISSYGLYKIDNSINDLAKVCGVTEESEIKAIKKFINKNTNEGKFDYDEMKKKEECKYYNKMYDDIILHFSKMYLKVKYIGTHAAGVAITGGELLQYTGLRIDSKLNKVFSVYDLSDLESINVIKFDILGLNTMSQIKEMEDLTEVYYSEDWLNDFKIYEEFAKGNSDGIFQFEKDAVKNILMNIECDCFDDLVAASSMNRPGPLSLGMPQHYADNKFNVEEAKKSKYYEYTKETYGTIVYQEQLQRICVEVGQMSWKDSDRVMKILKRSGEAILTGAYANVGNEKEELIKIFVDGATKNGYTKKEATELFEKLLVYSFNKGHGVGYTLISLTEMYYKVYYPIEYWTVKLKFCQNAGDLFKFKMCAISEGILLFLPHVNYSKDFSIREVQGDKIIQEGLSSLKFVGGKAAELIENERKENGIFKSEEDFISRCVYKGSGINKRTIEILKENGALEFDKNIYLKRVIKYNSALYSRR